MQQVTLFSFLIRALSGLSFLTDVLDLHRFYRVGEPEREDIRVEIEFSVKRTFDIPGTAEPMLFSLERQVRDREPPMKQSPEHLFCLLWRDNFVLKSLEKYHRA